MEIISLKTDVGVLRDVYDEATVSNNVCFVAILQKTARGLRIISGASVIGNMLNNYLIEYLPDVASEGLGEDKLLLTLEDEGYQETLGKILKELSGEISVTIKAERVQEESKGKKNSVLQGISLLVRASDDEEYNIPLTPPDERDRGKQFAIALDKKANRTTKGKDGKPVILKPIVVMETTVDAIRGTLKKYETMTKYRSDYVLYVEKDKVKLITGDPDLPNEVFARLPLNATVNNPSKRPVQIPLVPMLGKVVPSLLENSVLLEVYKEGERDYVSLKSVVRGDDDSSINKVRIVDIAAKDVLSDTIGDEGEVADDEELEPEPEPEEGSEPEADEEPEPDEDDGADEKAGESTDDEAVI